MAPRRHTPKRGETRMDAALDAMSPYGFSKTIVRRTVHQLLKVYGGADGWPFVEDSGYTVLIDALLEQQTQPQDGLIEYNPGDGPNEASPAADCSNRALVPCSNTATSDDAPLTNQAIDPVSAASETGDQLPLSTMYTLSATNETGNELAIRPVDISSVNNETVNQVPIKVIDTVSAENESDCKAAGNLALDEIHGITPAQSLKTNPSQPTGSLCPQKRRPCHGWISNDDDEGELIELPPAFLRNVSYMLVNDGVN